MHINVPKNTEEVGRWLLLKIRFVADSATPRLNDREEGGAKDQAEPQFGQTRDLQRPAEAIQQATQGMGK